MLRGAMRHTLLAIPARCLSTSQKTAAWLPRQLPRTDGEARASLGFLRLRSSGSPGYHCRETAFQRAGVSSELHGAWISFEIKTHYPCRHALNQSERTINKSAPAINNRTGVGSRHRRINLFFLRRDFIGCREAVASRSFSSECEITIITVGNNITLRVGMKLSRYKTRVWNQPHCCCNCSCHKFLSF